MVQDVNQSSRKQLSPLIKLTGFFHTSTVASMSARKYKTPETPVHSIHYHQVIRYISGSNTELEKISKGTE